MATAMLLLHTAWAIQIPLLWVQFCFSSQVIYIYTTTTTTTTTTPTAQVTLHAVSICVTALIKTTDHQCKLGIGVWAEIQWYAHIYAIYTYLLCHALQWWRCRF